MIKFNHSDVWLLQSILYSARDKDATLRDIIGMGDGINKAIFTPGELQQGFNRLLDANLINWNNNKYSITNTASKKLSHLLSSDLTVFEAQDEISRIIGATPWSPNEPFPEFDPKFEPPFFSLRDYKKAYRKYNNEMMKVLRKLEKEEKRKGVNSDSFYDQEDDIVDT